MASICMLRCQLLFGLKAYLYCCNESLNQHLHACVCALNNSQIYFPFESQLFSAHQGVCRHRSGRLSEGPGRIRLHFRKCEWARTALRPSPKVFNAAWVSLAPLTQPTRRRYSAKYKIECFKWFKSHTVGVNTVVGNKEVPPTGLTPKAESQCRLLALSPEDLKGLTSIKWLYDRLIQCSQVFKCSGFRVREDSRIQAKIANRAHDMGAWGQPSTKLYKSTSISSASEHLVSDINRYNSQYALLFWVDFDSFLSVSNGLSLLLLVRTRPNQNSVFKKKVLNGFLSLVQLSIVQLLWKLSRLLQLS